MCSSASSGKSSPTPPMARTTSRRCGAAVTCCGSLQKKRQKSQPEFFLGISKPRPSAGVFAWGGLSPAIDRNQAWPRVRRPWLRQKARADCIERVKSRFIAHHFEAIAQAYSGFRRAEDKVAVARQRPGQAAKHVALRILIEIDQNVPAERSATA